MNPVLLILSIVGALTVLTFVCFVIVGVTRGWRQTPAPLLLSIAAGGGILCGVLGVVVAFTSP